MTPVIGIDPGKTGAIALIIDGQLHAVEDMPDHPALLAGLIRRWRNTDHPFTACVEEVHAMPKQGITSSFNFGQGYGQILGVLAGLQIPVFHVPPSRWRPAMVGRGADKTAARHKAIERWPAFADSFRRVRDDGRAEAALIAMWYLEQRERNAA